MWFTKDGERRREGRGRREEGREREKIFVCIDRYLSLHGSSYVPVYLIQQSLLEWNLAQMLNCSNN